MLCCGYSAAMRRVTLGLARPVYTESCSTCNTESCSTCVHACLSIKRRLKSDCVHLRMCVLAWQYAANGDLQRFLDHHMLTNTYVPEKELWRLLKELSLAVQHLHSKVPPLCA